MSSERTTFTIGTRKSKLALLQTDLVRNALQEIWPHYEFKVLTRDVAGDLNKVTPLRNVTTKNLWTEELEEYLIAGQIDFVVHSLKGTRLPVSCCPTYCGTVVGPANHAFMFSLQMYLPRFQTSASSVRLCPAKTRETCLLRRKALLK